MLLISRKKDQDIIIKLPDGREIYLCVVKIDSRQVKIGLQAADDIKIRRGEIDRNGDPV